MRDLKPQFRTLPDASPIGEDADLEAAYEDRYMALDDEDYDEEDYELEDPCDLCHAPAGTMCDPDCSNHPDY